ncbi:allophanate hydrolase [Aliidiomarina iranensis]|uniref:Allophanate hydrolase n=1 Tax=Aliidiomarina iranensis TaxID=1434071 RepID=A0A432VQJ4_9GAMM|nr:carboxyltransferase domain-containing protein [Aliidiomarina iranensis]RUO18466.1 allophanate hydrolase [Aliidiomarina iranensis]
MSSDAKSNANSLGAEKIAGEVAENSKRPEPTFVHAGVDAVLMQFGEQLDPCMPGFLASLRAQIIAELNDVVYEVVPSYASLLVYYEPRAIGTYDLEQVLNTIASDTPWLCSPWSADSGAPGKLVEVPIYYYELDDNVAENDMAFVCEQTGLARNEVIARHSGRDYQVYALGFAPGFAYLGALDKALQLPRLANPRKNIGAGSVGIAEAQTAVYPQASPGGWHIIGYSPFTWFEPKNHELTPVQVGDRIRFKAISKAEYEHAKAKNQAQLGGAV